METLFDNSPNIKTVGIDSGFGYMKVVAEEKKIKFQNIAARGISRVIEKSIREINPRRADQLKEIDVLIEMEGHPTQHYFFGELAFDGSEPSYIWEKDRVNAERARAAIFTAIALVTNEEESYYYVMTGLPLTHLPKLKNEYENNLPGTAIVTFQGGPLAGQKRKITILKARPTAQGYGIFLNEILDENGAPTNKSLLKGQVGIIDVGMGTVNINLIRDGQPKDIGSDTLELGMNHVHQAIRQFIIEQGGYITIEEVEKVYSTGIYETFNETKINFEPVKQTALRDLANIITQAVSRSWNIPALKKIIVGGGGGQAIYDLLPFQQKMLANDSQFANALGYYKGATRMLRRHQDESENIN